MDEDNHGKAVFFLSPLVSSPKPVCRDGWTAWMDVCVVCQETRMCGDGGISEPGCCGFFMQTCPEKQQVGCHDLKPDSKGSFLGNAHSATPLIGR